MEKSKVDPTSFSYMLNPLRRAQYMYWRALAVSTRSEGTSLASEVALDCTISWLTSRGFGKIGNNAKSIFIEKVHFSANTDI